MPKFVTMLAADYQYDYVIGPVVVAIVVILIIRRRKRRNNQQL